MNYERVQPRLGGAEGGEPVQADAVAQLAEEQHRVVALQVAFERQTLKPGFSLDRL